MQQEMELTFECTLSRRYEEEKTWAEIVTELEAVDQFLKVQHLRRFEEEKLIELLERGSFQ